MGQNKNRVREFCMRAASITGTSCNVIQYWRKKKCVRLMCLSSHRTQKCPRAHSDLSVLVHCHVIIDFSPLISRGLTTNLCRGHISLLLAVKDFVNPFASAKAYNPSGTMFRQSTSAL